MSIFIETAPQETAYMLKAGMSRVAIRPFQGLPTPAHVLVAERIDRVGPIPLYHFDSTELDERSFPKDDWFFGWRYLLLSDDLPAGAATVRFQVDKEPGFHAYHYDGFGPVTIETVARAEALFEEGPEDFALRLLESKELCFIAVWLHSPGNDVILPMEDMTAAGIDAGSPQLPDKVAAALVQRVLNGAASEDPPTD